jgi:DNA-binding transcriptional LysR family regulator
MNLTLRQIRAFVAVARATSTALAGTLLPWAIREFTARFAGIRCVLKDCAEQEIRHRVRAGDVDLGVGTALDADPKLTEVPLLEDSLVAGGGRVSGVRARDGYPASALAEPVSRG